MKQGFTIIEFIVYIAVLAIIGGAVFTLFLWTLSVHTKARVLQETALSAQFAMEIVMREAREAESLYLPTSSATQISFQTKTFMPLGETTGFIDFFLCQDRLCMKKEEQNPVAVTSNTIEVTSLVFTAISTDTDFPSLQMIMEVRHRNPNNRPELEAILNLTSTASLR